MQPLKLDETKLAQLPIQDIETYLCSVGIRGAAAEAIIKDSAPSRWQYRLETIENAALSMFPGIPLAIGLRVVDDLMKLPGLKLGYIPAHIAWKHALVHLIEQTPLHEEITLAPGNGCVFIDGVEYVIGLHRNPEHWRALIRNILSSKYEGNFTVYGSTEQWADLYNQTAFLAQQGTGGALRAEAFRKFPSCMYSPVLGWHVALTSVQGPRALIYTDGVFQVVPSDVLRTAQHEVVVYATYPDAPDVLWQLERDGYHV